MAGGFYSHTNRAAGTRLTAAIYNQDHENHIANLEASKISGGSVNVSAMQTQVDPGEAGSENLAVTVMDELARLRFAIAEMKGRTYWYETPAVTLSEPSMNHILYNTSFVVWQEGLGRSDSTGSPLYMDGWVWARSGAVRATVSLDNVEKPTTVECGHTLPGSLTVVIDTGDASIGASDYAIIGQPIEGHYFLPIAHKEFTLSFWVYSATTGIHCVSFRNGGHDRSYVAEYTINNSNTWEYKTIVVPVAPSTGTWYYDHLLGLSICWALACGSDYQITAGAWVTGDFLATSNQVNNAQNAGNTFRLAAPKITPGPVAGKWTQIPIDLEIRRCQRYYYSTWPVYLWDGSGLPATLTGYSPGILTADYLHVWHSSNTYHCIGSMRFPVEMRVDPVLNSYDGALTLGNFNYYDFTASAWNTSSWTVTTASHKLAGNKGGVGWYIATIATTHFALKAEARLNL